MSINQLQLKLYRITRDYVQANERFKESGDEDDLRVMSLTYYRMKETIDQVERALHDLRHMTDPLNTIYY